ncbi:MAG: esterase family protein [Erysipelotrichaceae bacterium]|nr:esterase family protein [Erysipelotrichaceae bacterium]
MGHFKGNIYSSCLKRNVTLNILFPDRSNDVDPLYEDEPKVLYLLHGLGGNEDEWTRFSKIEYYAKKYNFAIIMPGVGRSFYCNTKQGIRYFDFVSDELPAIVGKWFKISTDKNDTFIAGESMGGYGALKIALSKPERFAAAASLSGVVDYESFKTQIEKGTFEEMEISELDLLQDDVSLKALANGLVEKEERPRLILQCGTEDFLLEDNRRFSKELKEMGYDHLYKEGPGDHEWPYWDKAVQYAFMFFRRLDIEESRLY